jgi:hypothetical protein
LPFRGDLRCNLLMLAHQLLGQPAGRLVSAIASSRAARLARKIRRIIAGRKAVAVALAPVALACNSG